MTLPGTDRWTSTLLATWVGGLVEVPVVAGPKVPDMPNRVAIVTLTSGAAESVEGLADAPGFQLRVRGAPNNQGDAEVLAMGVDVAIRFAEVPATVGGVRVVSVQRLSSRPAPLSDDPDRGGRYTYVSTYVTVIL